MWTDMSFGIWFAVCGARYKTRPGLTYHYGHSHRDGASDENSRESVHGGPGPGPGGPAGPPAPLMGLNTFSGAAGGMLGGVSGVQQPGVVGGQPGQEPGPAAQQGPLGPAVPLQQPPVYQDSYVTFLNHPAGTAFIFFTLFIFSVFVVCLHVNEFSSLLFTYNTRFLIIIYFF